MEVFLVNAPVKLKSEHSSITPPLGLAYIGAVLKKHGYDVDAIDFNLDGINIEWVENAFKDPNTRIVGISTYTETY